VLRRCGFLDGLDTPPDAAYADHQSTRVRRGVSPHPPRSFCSAMARPIASDNHASGKIRERLAFFRVRRQPANLARVLRLAAKLLISCLASSRQLSQFNGYSCGGKERDQRGR
jgi:hypothetical protein